MAKRTPTAGDFASAYLQQGPRFISPEPGELLSYSGACYEGNPAAVKQDILRFIAVVGGDAFATARMTEEVYETISISQSVAGTWRPFLLSNPKAEPVSVLTLRDCNLWINEDGSHSFKPHSPDVVSTTQTEYAADRTGGTCPEFNAFMDWFTKGRESLLTFLLQIMALLLCRFLDPQIIPVLYGPGGNGKGVYLNAIRQLLGDGNCCSVPMDRLGKRFSLNQLKHRMVNLDADLCESSKSKEATLKQLVDGSLMEFERKYRDATSATCYARFLFASNAFIPFRDKSNGLGRRIRYVPCDNIVTSADRVQKLERLFHLPGVLNRVLAEVPGLVKYGLIDCPLVAETTRAGRLEGNPARQFLADHVAPREGSRLVKSYVYGMYRDWCENNGYHSLSSSNFGREIAGFFAAEARDGTVVLDGKTSRGPNLVQSLNETDKAFAKRKAKHKPTPRQNCYVGLTYCANGIDNLEPLPDVVIEKNQDMIPF